MDDYTPCHPFELSEPEDTALLFHYLDAIDTILKNPPVVSAPMDSEHIPF